MSRKDECKMLNVPKEYLLLFNAITDAEDALQQMRARLIAAQQQAEELFLEEEETAQDSRDEAPRSVS